MKKKCATVRDIHCIQRYSRMFQISYWSSLR